MSPDVSSNIFRVRLAGVVVLTRQVAVYPVVVGRALVATVPRAEVSAGLSGLARRLLLAERGKKPLDQTSLLLRRELPRRFEHRFVVFSHRLRLVRRRSEVS